MNEFPDWAVDFLGSQPQKVSHGLNLALKLRNPAQLPLMLWDVVVARPKIQRALDRLSFLHFARFVPSWDGTALMVTTEFDGPLEPYVMDFVIAIGDVFDRLLGYVDGAPPLPVRDHPDEFLEFVRTWNRVPFFPRVAGSGGLFPADFDYPLYSAYAGLSAIDIAGPRSKLPPPVLDRPAAWVDLGDVQGNILRPYAARTARHLFLRVTHASKARQWLSQGFAQAPAGSPWGQLTSGAPWPQAAGGGTDKPEFMANAAFTFEGLVVLLPARRGDLDSFPPAFKQGAQARAQLNGDLGASRPALWKFGRDDQHIHVVLTLQTFADEATAGTPWQRFVAAWKALEAAATANGLVVVDTHEAQARPDNRVYFEYVDGISEPRISGQCPARLPDFQPAASPGEFLLGPDYADIYLGRSIGKMPLDLALNGTFGALRLMQQDVQAFDDMLAREQATRGIDPDVLRARLMGRWKDGQPLALEPVGPPTGAAVNGFDYAPSWEHPSVPEDHAGQRCPVGAHIRRTNPRGARVAGQPHSRRLIRRGMPSRWHDGGTVRKGLLGLFIGASLERQFEFIQRQWIQGDLAASGIRGTQDPIAGLRDSPTPFRPWPDRPDLEVNVPPLITTCGSLYLFFPGMQALRNLDQAQQAPVAVRPAAPPSAPALPIDVVLRESLFQLDRVTRLLTPEGFADPELRSQAGLALEAFNLPLGLPQDVMDLLLDLVDRGLGSASVKQLIESFAPRHAPEAGPVPGVPTADVDPADPRFIADPYSRYATLQATVGKLVWVPAHQAYWVLDLANAIDVFKNPTGFVQQPSSVKLRGIITLDDPRHTVVRKAVVAALTAAATPARVATYVDQAAASALQRIGSLEQFDFVAMYGDPVPGDVFWRLLGLPEDHRDACAALAGGAMRHFGQPRQRGLGDDVVFADMSLRLTTRLALLLAEALLGSTVPLPTRFKGTLIGELAARTVITIPTGQRTMSFIESLMTLVQTVLAGFMSMQFLMGSAVRNLLRPDPRDRRVPWRVLADLLAAKDPSFPAALRGALEEARRVDPPVTIVQRYAGAGGGPIGAVTIPPDSAVFVVVASAHRDPAFGPQPEQFQWDRVSHAHLAFGHASHECVGLALQNLVVPAALTRLLATMPELALCDDEAVPAWLDNLYFRSLQALPVLRCK
jgi:cytochrome P450/deferrochelatase/peroxidase EfeB